MHPNLFKNIPEIEPAIHGLAGRWGVAWTRRAEPDGFEGDEPTHGSKPSTVCAGSKTEIAVQAWREMGRPGRTWNQSAAGGWVSESCRSRARSTDPATWDLVFAVDPQGHTIALPRLLDYGEQLAPQAADPRWSAWEVFQARRWSRSKPWNGEGPVPGTGKRSYWRSHPISSPKMGRLVRAAAWLLSEESELAASLAHPGVAEPALRRLVHEMTQASNELMSWMGNWDDWCDRKPRSESGGWKTARAPAQWGKHDRGLRPKPRAGMSDPEC